MDLRPNAYILADSSFEPEWEAQIEKALVDLTHKYSELVKKGSPGVSSEELQKCNFTHVRVQSTLYTVQYCCTLYSILYS